MQLFVFVRPGLDPFAITSGLQRGRFSNVADEAPEVGVEGLLRRQLGADGGYALAAPDLDCLHVAAAVSEGCSPARLVVVVMGEDIPWHDLQPVRREAAIAGADEVVLAEVDPLDGQALTTVENVIVDRRAEWPGGDGCLLLFGALERDASWGSFPPRLAGFLGSRFLSGVTDVRTDEDGRQCAHVQGVGDTLLASDGVTVVAVGPTSPGSHRTPRIDHLQRFVRLPPPRRYAVDRSGAQGPDGRRPVISSMAGMRTVERQCEVLSPDAVDEVIVRLLKDA